MKFRIFGLLHHTHPSAAQFLDDALFEMVWTIMYFLYFIGSAARP
jgi:hypothetical protein